MRFTVGHIVGCLGLGALLAGLDSWLVPVVEALDDISSEEFRCMFNIDVRQCAKYFFMDDNHNAAVRYGCCKFMKICSPRINCHFSSICDNIKACPPEAEVDDDEFLDDDEGDHDDNPKSDGKRDKGGPAANKTAKSEKGG